MDEKLKNQIIKVTALIVMSLFLLGCVSNEKKPQESIEVTQKTPEKEPDVYKETPGIYREMPEATGTPIGTPELLQVDTDRQTIAQMSLEWAVLGKNISDYNLIKDKDHLVLSTRNINKGYNFSLGNITISILTPEEIKQKSEAEGDYLYFEFEMLEIYGSRATVKLNNIWAQNETSRKTIAYLSGGGATIPFTKIGGKWVRQDVTETWIS
jgi:hypothetical protein